MAWEFDAICVFENKEKLYVLNGQNWSGMKRTRMGANIQREK